MHDHRDVLRAANGLLFLLGVVIIDVGVFIEFGFGWACIVTGIAIALAGFVGAISDTPNEY